MPRNALLVEILPEDIAAAQKQDKWNCAIVRAIQRKLPESIRVQADTAHITFTLPEDGPTGTRYVCDTPKGVAENVIKNFDLTKTIPDEWLTFSLVAREAIPVQHKPRHRQTARNANQRKNRAKNRQADRSTNPNVHNYNRFLDFENPVVGGDAE